MCLNRSLYAFIFSGKYLGKYLGFKNYLAYNSQSQSQRKHILTLFNSQQEKITESLALWREVDGANIIDNITDTEV